jgi:acetyl esterase
VPLDRYAEQFLERLKVAGVPAAATQTVVARREALASLLAFTGARTEAATRSEDWALPGPAGELPIRIYTPAGSALVALAARSLPGLVYFHGGGLVAGSLDTHDGIARTLAEASGCRLVSVGYRLAPEARFPAAIEDGSAAVRWIAANAARLGIDAARLGICGDSAGATLAAVVCQALSRTRGPRLRLQFLLCPILDLAAESASRRALAEGYFLDRATLQHDLMHYLPAGVDAADPRVSPLRERRLTRLPPTLIHTAEFDPLRDEGRQFAARLKRAGVRTQYRCHSGMIHLFYGMGALIPYAAGAWGTIGADIRALLA